MATDLILGSGSERRRKILSELGISFRVVVPRVSEVFHLADARKTAAENCRRKMDWCRQRHPQCRIITADTVVQFQERCVLKPSTMDEAAEFLRMFSGKDHEVLTAVALATPGCDPVVETVESRVTFKRLSDEAVAEYLRQVDPMDKAGAYNIDQASELIIERYSGSFTNIVGLPVETVSAWLRAGDQLSARIAT